MATGGNPTGAVHSQVLDEVIDSRQDGVLRHIGQIADAMRMWEGKIADELGLTPAAVADIKAKYPNDLQLQIREALLRWRERKGCQATYNNLILVFQQARCPMYGDLVKQVAMEYDQSGHVANVSLSGSRGAVVPHSQENSSLVVQSSDCVSMSDSNTTTIKGIFSRLLRDIRNALESKQNQEDTVRDVQQHLTTVLRLSGVPRTNFADMFEYVSCNGGWDFQNCSLAENLITHFLPDQYNLIAVYKKQLTGYAMTERLIDYVRREGLPTGTTGEADSGMSLRLIQQNCRVLQIKLRLSRRLYELSLQYVRQLWERFAEEFDIPFLSTIIRKIVEGSLIVVWLVLPSSAKRIAEGTKSNAEKSIDFFLQNEIVHVAIDEQTIFDSAQLLLQLVLQGNWKRLRDNILKKHGRLFDLNAPYKDQDGKSLLMIAAEMGHELLILTLLDKGADISFKQESTGRTALFFAAENGHEDSTSILLGYGADPCQIDSAGNTAMDVAHEKVLKEFEPYVLESAKPPTVTSISTGQKIVEAFGEAKDVVFGRLIQPYYMLTSDVIGAAKSSDNEAMEYIIVNTKDDPKNVVSTREEDKYGWTALMYASEKGNSRMVELLLGRGANPNDKSKYNNWNCLILASRRGSLKVVKMLLEHGANPNPKPEKENTDMLSPLLIALAEGRTSVPLLLIYKGANVKFTDEKGKTPLMEASKLGHLNLVKAIAELDADLNAQNENEGTSLMVASKYGHTKVVKELGSRGAELNLATTAGDTALHIAALWNHSEVVEALAELGADLNVVNKDGLTALMIAANHNYVDVIDALVKGGADPNQPHQEKKWTAIFFAAKNGYIDAVRKLLHHGAKAEILNEDGTVMLTVVDVASYFKQESILDALGTSVDSTPGASAARDSTAIESVWDDMNSWMKDLELRLKRI